MIASKDQHEILVLCHPPRFAVEVDGVRLPSPAYERASQRTEPGLLLTFEYDESWSLQKTSRLRRP